MEGRKKTGKRRDKGEKTEIQVYEVGTYKHKDKLDLYRKEKILMDSLEKEIGKSSYYLPK